MTKKRVAELTGAELDRTVANAHGMMLYTPDWQPSRNWAQGGPLIDREGISIISPSHNTWGSGRKGWRAEMWVPYEDDYPGRGHNRIEQLGHTPLEAAMRCYVASRFGEEVPDADLV